MPSFRYLPEDATFDVGGSSVFFQNDNDIPFVMSLLNTKIVLQILKVNNPTLNFQVKNIRDVPLFSKVNRRSIENNYLQLSSISKLDWDSFETSWGFTGLQVLAHRSSHYLSKAYTSLRHKWETATQEMKQLEERNNCIFIEAYSLQNELTPEVPLKEITLICNPHYRYGNDKNEKELEKLLLADTMKEILSYIVGCMMGRYSMDKPGLILADAEDTIKNYLTKVELQLNKLNFRPDTDGIIPILDGEWFEDDIVARTREFLVAAFGATTLEENIRFIEDALGKDLRKYFTTDFYKDHLKTYKKRPIYWLFQSPKKGFSALVYLHRYTRDTANTLLNGYLREFMTKLKGRIAHIDHLLASEATSAREKAKALKESDQYKKVLRECEEYERNTLLPLAQARMELGLDDGVKVNYQKLGDALAPIPGLAAKDEE